MFQSCMDWSCCRVACPVLSMSAYSNTQPTPVASGPRIGVTPWGSLLEMVESFSRTRQRTAKLRLARQQEGRLRRDLFSLVQPLQHLVVVSGQDAGLDLHRLESSFAALDESVSMLPGGEQGVVGYGEPVPERNLHVHVHEHSRLQRELSVGESEPRAHRARLLVD